MKFDEIIKEYDEKGRSVTGSDFPILYHLTDYTGVINTSLTQSIKSKSNYISTTHNSTMTNVGGRSHYHFRFILDGEGLINDFGGSEYSSFARTPDGSSQKWDEDEIGIDTKSVPASYIRSLGTSIDFRSRSFIQWMFYDRKYSGHTTNGATAIETLDQMGIPFRAFNGDRLPVADAHFLERCKALKDHSFADALKILVGEHHITAHDGSAITPTRLEKEKIIPEIVAAANLMAGTVGEADVTGARAAIHTIIQKLSTRPALHIRQLEQSGIVNHELEPSRVRGLLITLANEDEDEFTEMLAFIKDEQDRRIDAFGSNTKYRREHYRTA